MQIRMRVGGVLTEDRTEKLVAVIERSAGEVCEYPKLQLLLCKGRGEHAPWGNSARAECLSHRRPKVQFPV